jgi:hypothetical protein
MNLCVVADLVYAFDVYTTLAYTPCKRGGVRVIYINCLADGKAQRKSIGKVRGYS